LKCPGLTTLLPLECLDSGEGGLDFSGLVSDRCINKVLDAIDSGLVDRFLAHVAHVFDNAIGGLVGERAVGAIPFVVVRKGLGSDGSINDIDGSGNGTIVWGTAHVARKTGAVINGLVVKRARGASPVGASGKGH
tara:strand:- start:879 stop:1283 length:405 start_codon:yes stop_codon:yes gene_type:complete